ncbi:uncharacterized protein CTRU02_214608 [Colletotrichum truncatum]|uniref:Uncharacterized protein n=1 Tax=Colletotrichum truncatum TaxID=5467 RepID=A0ACC3YF88_COLTU|nr:uncharacterized protein CTRU02_09556 [Colletotrichum truncatum]KAF6788238.1 hypothetical protein CTRU02_09556 [Colletotrichum truncatum]
MYFPKVPGFLTFLIATGVFAGLHEFAICVQNRQEQPIGGTPFSVSYSWAKSYSIDQSATKCACDYYKHRNTGNQQWDKCPDCVFDPNQLVCHSAGKHIGGDEMTYYCSKKCNSEGAEGS